MNVYIHAYVKTCTKICMKTYRKIYMNICMEAYMKTNTNIYMKTYIKIHAPLRGSESCNTDSATKNMFRMVRFREPRNILWPTAFLYKPYVFRDN